MSYVRDDLRPLQRRLAALLLLTLFGILILLSRLWVLQVLQQERWKAKSKCRKA